MSYHTLSLLLLIAMISPSLQADTIIPEHGQYTQTYQSDWSQLDTGEALAGNSVDPSTYTTVVGEDVRAGFRYADEPLVQLSNVHLNVSWNRAAYDKLWTTLMLFENVDTVILENISIVNTDSNYKAYDTIRIEGANQVIIRNLRLSGTVQSYHLRLDGCKDVLIENVEIAGSWRSCFGLDRKSAIPVLAICHTFSSARFIGKRIASPANPDVGQSAQKKYPKCSTKGGSGGSAGRRGTEGCCRKLC